MEIKEIKNRFSDGGIYCGILYYGKIYKDCKCKFIGKKESVCIFGNPEREIPVLNYWIEFLELATKKEYQISISRKTKFKDFLEELKLNDEFYLTCIMNLEGTFADDPIDRIISYHR